jgi:sec-independent protein translocase protein TatB
MFGMGFMEIFLILVIAIMALGPEKLPSAAVDMVKFFRKFKSGLNDAKTTIDNELNIAELKDEAEKFKASVNEIKGMASIDLDDISSLDDDDKPKPKTQEITQEKKVTLTKKENISFDKESKV